MKNLNNNELIAITGGDGFSHDVACALRYTFVYFGYGYTFKSYDTAKTFADAANSGGCAE